MASSHGRLPIFLPLRPIIGNRRTILARTHVSPSQILNVSIGLTIYPFFTHKFVHPHHQNQNIHTRPLRKAQVTYPLRFLYSKPRQPAIRRSCIITSSSGYFLVSTAIKREFQVEDERNWSFLDIVCISFLKSFAFILAIRSL